MARPPKPADYKALRRLHTAAGSREELTRWLIAALREGKRKTGPKTRDRVRLNAYAQLVQLRGRQRTKAIEHLIRKGRIRGSGIKASTVALFDGCLSLAEQAKAFDKTERTILRYTELPQDPRDLRELEEIVAQYADAFRESERTMAEFAKAFRKLNLFRVTK